jgi:hypothetical protein
MATAMTLDQLKEELFENIRYRLGSGIVDIEADPEHFEAAYKYALKVYRQRAQNATNESYTLMTINKHQNSYILPSEFINVRQVFRRTVGLETGPAASSFDPFSSAILNTYLLNYNYAGGLATYDFYAQYIELAARMFGGYVIFTFNPVTKELKMVRDPKGQGEQILIWGDLERSESELLQDPGSGIWIGDWVFSQIKYTIGEAREKFATIAGPSGGSSLNGAALKAEAKDMQEKLLKDLQLYTDHSQPLTWVIG